VGVPQNPVVFFGIYPGIWSLVCTRTWSFALLFWVWTWSCELIRLLLFWFCYCQPWRSYHNKSADIVIFILWRCHYMRSWAP